MTESGVAAGKAVIQIRGRGGKLFQIIGMNGQNDPFMRHMIDLRKVMTFVLVDEKDISRLKVIKSVINKKLFSAGDGKINFIAVMDMDLHWFFIVIQMCNRKRAGSQTGVNGCLTGVGEFHK